MVLEQNDYWQKKLFRYYKHIDKQAHKIIHDPIMADAALNDAIEKLEHEDWKLLRKFRGKDASFKSYLTVVVTRLCQSYARKILPPPPRIPQWIIAQGTVWVKTYLNLCKKNLTLDETLEMICGHLTNQQPCWIEVQKAAAGIMSRLRKCGRYVQGIISKDPADMENGLSDDDHMPDLDRGRIREAIREAAIMDALIKVVYDELVPGRYNDIQTIIDAFQKNLKLTPEERILLKLVYREGYTVSKAGRCLGLNSNEVHGKHRRSIDKIKTALNATVQIKESEIVTNLFQELLEVSRNEKKR